MPTASHLSPTQRHQLTSILSPIRIVLAALVSRNGMTTRYCLPLIAILAATCVPSGDSFGPSIVGSSANTSTGTGPLSAAGFCTTGLAPVTNRANA